MSDKIVQCSNHQLIVEHDHGTSPAQLREKVEALDLVVKEAYRAIDALNTRAADTERRVVELERLSVSLLDRVNQLVEFHGIRPIGQSPKAECTREELLKAVASITNADAPQTPYLVDKARAAANLAYPPPKAEEPHG